MARRGARVLGEPRTGSASEAWREAVARGRSDTEKGRSRPPEPWAPEVWVEDPPAAARPPRRTQPKQAPPPADEERQRRHVNRDVASELGDAVGPARAPKLEARLAEAVKAYDRDRYPDALRILRVLGREAPASPSVRELTGLTLYRMGRWAAAVKELDAFRALTGSHDQHPVLMDCNRALRRWKAVDTLWAELREASPSGELMTEGRIVVAGAMADKGGVRGAIRLLEKARPATRSPRLHHLRQLYALADLYERAGDIPRARELFRSILRHDREFVDVAERLAALD